MPGLKQLQKFNSDLLNLGEEVKIRAARGEKPVTVPIPKEITTEDDSQEFRGGLPTLSEEEQAQADAAELERQRQANDFSDFNDDDTDVEEEEIVPVNATPDVSDLLDTTADMDLGDLDLSDFMDEEPEEEIPEEPEEVAIEDMDLEALLAPQPKVEPVEEKKNDVSLEDTVDISENFFNEPQNEEPEEIPEADNVDELESSESLVEDELTAGMPDMNLIFGNSEETSEPASDSVDETFGEMQNLSSDFSMDELPEMPAEENASDDFGMDSLDLSSINLDDDSTEKMPSLDDFNLPDMSDIPSIDESVESAESFETPAVDDLPEISDFPVMDELPSDDLNADFETEAVDDGFNDLNADFETENNALDLNSSIPNEFNEVPDVNIDEIVNETPASDESLSADLPSMDDFGTGDDFSLPETDADESLSTDLPSMDDFGMGDDLNLPETGSDEDLNLPDMENDTFAEFNSFERGEEPVAADDDEFSLSDDFFNDGVKDKVSPDMEVPDVDIPEESFDTSDIAGLSFEGQGDFELGNISQSENDEFSIPGFSDTVTADLTKKPVLDTPDFSVAEEASKPKNTFTDNEYKRFQKNLADYPLNVRMALEDLVVKNEFTDDAVFAVLEKVLRKVPARQLANELEKMLDVQLDVPRDFEKRSAAEYAAYKKSLEYQLKNRIIPGAIISVTAAVIIYGLFIFTNTFIVKPLRAESLYKQGYKLIEQSLYPQSEDKFNLALTFKPKKHWFYDYAESYRDHHQYERARVKYRSILNRYNHEKQAGLDWAHMEVDELSNYEEGERILKREVLDFHSNDQEALLNLADLYLEWGTELDPEKMKEAKKQYDWLINLYGTNNTYLSRLMRYYIRTDDLNQVLWYKSYFLGFKKNSLGGADWTELSGYLLDKRYGKLKPYEEQLRSKIEDLKQILEKAQKYNSDNPVPYYNLGRFYIYRDKFDSAMAYLNHSVDSFQGQTHRTKKETYNYIDAHRLLGELYRDRNNSESAASNFMEGIKIFEYEKDSSGFEANENIGNLYADMGDYYFYASGGKDSGTALDNYYRAIENQYDNSSVRYKIGYINYENEDFKPALYSFIKAKDSAPEDTHLLLALANTLSMTNSDEAARGYYEALVDNLQNSRQKKNIVYTQLKSGDEDFIRTYMMAHNNLGVTKCRIGRKTGNTSLYTSAIVNFQESLQSWDVLTRDKTDLTRAGGSNLAEQNIKYITNPSFDYEVQIYNEIARTLNGDKVYYNESR